MNRPPPLRDLLAGARRRTRLAIVTVLLGVLLTVISSAITEFTQGGLALRLLVTGIGVIGLVVVIVAVSTLVRWVNERSADLHLSLSTSNAVLWRLYPDEGRLEFVAGDPSVIGATAPIVTDLAGLRHLVDGKDAEAMPAALMEAAERGDPFAYTYRAHLPSRGARQISVRALPMSDGRGRRRIVGVSWDETDTRAAAERAERVSRLYAALGAIGRATRSADTLERLYEQVSLAAVDAGGFALAWAGLEDPETRRIVPVARAGPAVAYLDVVAVRGDAADATGRGPAGEALRQGQPIWSNAMWDDPAIAWGDAAREHGLQSVVAIPIRDPRRCPGVFLLYSDRPGFFSNSERTLLSRLGDDISSAAERLVVREEQRHQRELLTALVASAPVPVMTIDLDGRVKDIWNDAAAEVFGWTRAEVLGSPLPFVAEDARHETTGFIKRAAGGEVIRDAPIRRQRKDGTTIELLLAAAPVHDARGRVTAILGIMMDQTERLAAESRLAESESRFRALTEHAADVVYRYRLQPKPALEYVNPAVHEVLGYHPDELYAMEDPITTILHPDEVHRFLRIMADPEAIEGARVVLRWNHRDGSTAWVEHRGSLIREDDGRVVALEGIARDISERRRFEEELARLSRVVEQTNDSVIVTDMQGTIVYVNPAFEAMSGWSRKEAVGRQPSLIKSGQQPDEYYAHLWARITAGETFTGRVTNKRKDGTLYLADIAISPVRDAAGEIVNFVGIQRDVTRQRDLEEQLRQSQKMEALGQLTGGIAHDFNNLLTIILSNAGLLVEALADRPDLQKDVQAIRTAAGRGARVVRQLMQFGRRERLDPEPVDLGATTDELVNTFRRVLPENIHVEVEVEPGLPAAMADGTAVEQILLNLATNARDAMPDGGDLRFTVRRRQGTEDDQHAVWIVVSVRDTGIGMSREVVSRIFEPFYTTKPAGKGTGLGLAMVYGLMEQHGGRVVVYSEPGLGTTVRVLFPAAPEGVAPAVAVLGDPGPRGAGERLLLVEDEPGLRDVGRRILEKLGYQVQTAHDGANALELLATNTFDAMITDVVMPGMTGPQLARAVRERGITLPILFATGYAAKDVLADIGEDALLVEKPWTMDELARRIRQALGGD